MAGPAQDGDISSQGFPNAMRALQSAQGRQEGTLRKEGAAMAPDIQKASEALSQPRPERPKLDKVPAPPSEDTGKPGQEWIGAVTLLAGIAGAFTRQHLTNALTAFSSGIQGLKKGQTEAYQQAYTHWKAEADRAVSNNQMVLDEYRAALEDRQAGIDEQMQRINLTAIKFKDQIMADAASVQNHTLVAQIYSQQSIAHLRVEEANSRLKQQHDLAMDKIDAQLATRGLKRGEDGKITQDKEAAGSISDEDAQMAGEQLASGDTSVLTNWGRGTQGPQNLVKIRHYAYQTAREKYGDKAGPELARIDAEYQGLKAGERSLGTRGAGIGIAINELKQFIPIAVGLSEKIDRTQFPDINSVYLAAQRKTGGEAIARFVPANTALINAYSQILTRGGLPTDQSRTMAQEVISTAYAKGQYRAAADQIWQEANAAERGISDTRQDLGGTLTGASQSGRQSPVAASGHKPGDIIKVGSKSYRVLGGDPSDPDVEEVTQ